MKIGMFGLGFMGATHLRALRNIPGVELAAVVSDVPQQLSGDLSGIQGNIGGPGEVFDFSNVKKFTDAWEAMADPEIEAVDLCLPTHLHKPLAVEALKRGKHVLVEKPMALNGEETDAMLEAAREAKRVLMVAQVLRFHGAYQVLHDTVKSGRLGSVRSAFFRRRCAAPSWQRWVYDKRISGGGVFDLLIHDVDQCLWLFGAPEAVSAVGCEEMENGVDQLHAHLFYPGIGSVVITGGWHHPKSYPFSMEFTVVFEGGTLEFSSAGRPLTLYRADGTVEPQEVPDADCYQAEIEYFCRCCLDNRQPEECPPEDSARAVKLTALLAAARTENGTKVSCNL